MKKVYKKPTIEIESYELDEFVASCENTSPNHTRETCVINLGPWTVFLTNPGPCMEKPGLDDRNDGFCYHIPDENAQYFGS